MRELILKAIASLILAQGVASAGVSYKIDSHLEVESLSILKQSLLNPDQIASGQWDHLFQPTRSLHHVGTYESLWIRIGVHNSSKETKAIAIESHFSLPVFEIVPPLKNAKDFSPHRVTARAPPGHSFHYLRAASGGEFAVVSLGVGTLEQIDSMQKFRENFTIAFFSALAAIFLYNLLLVIFSVRTIFWSYLLYLSSVAFLCAILLRTTDLLGSPLNFAVNHLHFYSSLISFASGFYFLLSLNSAKNWHTQRKVVQAFSLLLIVSPIYEIFPVEAFYFYTFFGVSIALYLYLSGIKVVIKGDYAFLATLTSFGFVALAITVFGGVLGGVLELSFDKAIYLRCISAILESILLSISLGIDYRNRQHELSLYKQSLEGVMPPSLIKATIAKRDSILTDVRHREVTVMFIDIVGYSLSSQTLVPEQAFKELKQVLTDIKAFILKRGGIIDKTLGDGLLCFFGYNFLDEADPDHATKAMECAKEIQAYAVQNVLKYQKLMYPMRIGMNTAEICIGNMGSERMFDFTLSGEGVIMASRFEGACEPFKIILGPDTYQQVRKSETDRFYKRMIKVKHRKELVEAFEFNPHINEKIRSAKEAFWQYHHIKQASKRISFENEFISVATVHGMMRVVNASLGGLGLLSREQYLGKAVQFEIEWPFHQEDQNGELIVEVVWGDVRDDGFIHGVKFVGVTAKRCQERFDDLLHFAAQNDKPETAS